MKKWFLFPLCVIRRVSVLGLLVVFCVGSVWAQSDSSADGGQADDEWITMPKPTEEGVSHFSLAAMDIEKTVCGWGTVQSCKTIDGNPITLKGKKYVQGVGTHGPSKIVVKLNGSVTHFRALLGVDDEVQTQANSYPNCGRIGYKVYLRGQSGEEKVLKEGEVKCGEEPVVFDEPVDGWKYLILETTNGVDGENSSDHVDWANAYLVYKEQNSTPPCIVGEDELSSQLDCATRVFSQPNVRFIHKVRSNNPDAVVSVTGLPEGLTWNEKRQFVEGKIAEEGEYTYVAHCTLDGETNDTTIHLTVSKSLALPLPFMGWISWNSVEGNISEEIVRKAVALFKDKGLVECGWNTIMLDDLWHASTRADDGSPRPDATRFPNGMKAVADYVHSQGMNFGLYTDAAERTCANAFGSYGSETIDAQTYAEWGIDIVKCDYCNAPADQATAAQRYKTLADAFKAAGYGTRLYICEWGVREPWKWGAESGGVCWRISYDVRDCWSGTAPGIGVVQSIRDMKNLANYQGVNRLNDSDMLCLGLHAHGKSSNDLCGSGQGMTQDEYRTQFALWCMWSSPMALSFDPRTDYITDDDYTIMKNTELIALNQDPSCQQADLLSEADDLVMFAKDCENGDIALSVTNMSSETKTAQFDFSTIPHLDAEDTYTVRDLWSHTNLEPVSNGQLSCSVRSHATRVFRLSKVSSKNGKCSIPAAKIKAAKKRK